MCSGRSREPQKGVRPSVHPSVHPSIRPIHFSSSNQNRVFLFSTNREPRPSRGGRSDWSFELPSLITLDQLERDKPVTRGECLFQATWQASLGNEKGKMGRCDVCVLCLILGCFVCYLALVGLF